MHPDKFCFGVRNAPTLIDQSAATNTEKAYTDNAVCGLGRRNCWSVLRRRAVQTLLRRRGRARV